MRYLILPLILLWLLLCSAVHTPRHTIDSLRKVINTTKVDTVRVMTLARLSIQLASLKKFKEAEEAGLQAYQSAKQIRYERGIMEACYAMGSGAAGSFSHSKGLPYIKEGSILAEKSGNIKSRAGFYVLFWSVYHHESKYQLAIEYASRALAIYTKIGNRQQEAHCYSRMGVSHQVQGFYIQALDLHQKALRIFEDLNIRSSVAMTVNNIGDIYENIKKYDEAIKYYQKSIIYYGNGEEAMGIMMGNSGISSCELKKGDYDAALKHAQISLQVAERFSHKIIAGFCYLTMTDAYLHKNDYLNAQKYIEKALSVNEESGFKEGTVDALILQGRIFFRTQKYKDAITFLTQGLTLADTLKLVKQLSSASLLMAQSDSALKNYEKALYHYRRHKLFSDSLINSDKSKSIGRLEAAYQYDQQIKDQRQQQALADERSRFYYYLLGVGILMILMLTGFVIYRNRSKERINRFLRTNNERIQTQKIELESAYEELNSTFEQLQHQKAKIEDSLHYAYQIQTAILPDRGVFTTALPKHFIYYEPKDIVSGDFYWLAMRGKLVFFAVADCTGHGVPGAFMSVVSSNALHTAVNELGLTEPEVILHEADRKIRSVLRQDSNSESKDGMDISLCVLDTERLTLQFAGAGRPLYHLSNGNLVEIKGDKFPIGGGQHEAKIFTPHNLSLQRGDRLYLFTDGITDQFGGSPKKKFTPKRLHEFIINHQSLSIEAQGKLFHQTMSDWMTGQVQLDDLTLMAVEV